ncbi:polysaccharide biosynthesis protein [Shimazuella sp. AN120528]|uniref:putative polysaccharide biosynthesis protein n=1 Tax=Shimazuella soli TaxID=1892854 RepID=UPI001F0D369B|nr:polysaccharide biosynthesis protein [Shimazuella soli]MCH5584842.1 polysaccharide biosynthesis protein [Shimazuella soli]
MSNKIVKGTLILSVATLLTKILGSLFWAPLQNIAGDKIVGIYRISFPFYSILLMIASAGIPITVSKFVAERLARDDYEGAQKVKKAAAIILSLTGIVSGLILFFGAHFVANVMLESPQNTLPIQVLAVAILFVPVMGAYRGYFQGHQQMMPTGISQVIEQVIRVVTVIGLVYWLKVTGFGAEIIAAGATAGAVFGAIAGLIVVLWYNAKEKKPAIQVAPSSKESLWDLSKSIIAYAIPISLATLVLPLIGLVDSLTIPRILMEMGYNASMTGTLYGIYARGEPFVNIISTFSSSLTLALIPAIGAYVAKNNMEAVNNKISQAWMMTLVISLPASLGLSILAEPFNIAMYLDAKGTSTLAILAFSSVFSTLAVTSSGILQGLGYNKLPVRHLLIGAAVKFICNFIFVPFYGIAGSAIAMVIAYIVVCMLNIWMVFRKTNIKVSMKNVFMKPLFASILMAGVVYVSYQAMRGWFIAEHFDRWGYLWISFIYILIAIIVYFILLLLTKTVSHSELRMLPMGNKLVRFFQKVKLLKQVESM